MEKETSTNSLFSYAADRARLMERLQSQLAFRGGGADAEQDAPFGTILDLNERDDLLKPLWQRATERVVVHLSAWRYVPERAVPLARALLDALMVRELAPGLPEALMRRYDPETALDDLRSAMFRAEQI